MAEVVVALDLPSADDARRLLDRLPRLRWAKLGPMLFVEDGPRLIGELKARGIKVFLDLKWHDIPNSVGGAARAAALAGVDLATVHALGGEDMLRAAITSSGSMRVVAVSVLTSHTPEGYGSAMGRAADGLVPEVVRLAGLAMRAGVHGVVVSPLEISAVRSLVGPTGWIVVPGIRPAGSDRGDQQRTADPDSAARAGATHLVVGRPITQASDPEGAFDRVVAMASVG